MLGCFERELTLQHMFNVPRIPSMALFCYYSHSLILSFSDEVSNNNKLTNQFLFIQHGRLCSGDHILRIGDTDLAGMSSEQVAQVLRQCGNRVKLMIARGAIEEPTAPTSLGITLSSSPASTPEMRVRT